ncbi:hypothetical protein [Oribacterium sp. P6A1]|nr:hypothetical protein [Oribacterium sp. P6A1]
MKALTLFAENGYEDKFGVMVSELEAKNDNTIIFRFIDGTEIPIKVK